jgi:hypothetical protein
MNTFNPDPVADLYVPTNNIADLTFITAIAAGYQWPVASYTDHALVPPVDLLRSCTLNYGIPNLTLPLYCGISEDKQSHHWIVADAADQGNAEQLEVNFAPKL